MSSACGKYQVYKVYLSSKTHYKIDSYFMSTGQLSSMDHIHKISNPSLSVQTTYSNIQTYMSGSECPTNSGSSKQTI
ncbi:hypothetical protein YC2023_109788 [Brassica napus]